MRELSDIGLADLIEAVDRLELRDPSLIARVAAMLDIPLQSHAEPPLPAAAKKPPRPQATTAAQPAPQAHPLESDSLPSLITRSRSRPSAFATILPSLPPPTDEEHEPPPPFFPLFEPTLTRGLLGTAIATPNATGPIELDTVVERLARGEAVWSLPRRLVPTLRKGVQVLVDHSSGMVPFRRDASWLAGEIERVAGRERSAVLRFRGLPANGVSDPRRKTRRGYVPPAAGIPIVLITDFGISVDDLGTDRATTREWVTFLRQLQRSNDSLLAFVPFPRERCSRRINDLVTIIELDRHTTLQHVRAKVMRSWRRR